MNRRLAQLVIALLALVTGVTACGGGSDRSDGYRSAASGLCEASAGVDDGDIEGAESRFYDTVHQPLHDLAAEVSEVDRVIAARLLEAKEAVESRFDTDPAGLGEALRSLESAVDESLTAIGHDLLPCTSDEGA
jgi:hypothetical protein